MVHILYHGLPLCLFCDKHTPAEWPPGHNWVSIDDSNFKEHVNCRECLEERKKFASLRKKP